LSALGDGSSRPSRAFGKERDRSGRRRGGEAVARAGEAVNLLMLRQVVTARESFVAESALVWFDSFVSSSVSRQLVRSRESPGTTRPCAYVRFLARVTTYVSFEMRAFGVRLSAVGVGTNVNPGQVLVWPSFWRGSRFVFNRRILDAHNCGVATASRLGLDEGGGELCGQDGKKFSVRVEEKNLFLSVPRLERHQVSLDHIAALELVVDFGDTIPVERDFGVRIMTWKVVRINMFDQLRVVPTLQFVRITFHLAHAARRGVI